MNGVSFGVHFKRKKEPQTSIGNDLEPDLKRGALKEEVELSRGAGDHQALATCPAAAYSSFPHPHYCTLTVPHHRCFGIRGQDRGPALF